MKLNFLFFLIILIVLPFTGFNQSIIKYNPHERYDEAGGIFDIDSLRTLSINFYNANYHEILVNNWFEDNGNRLPAKIKLGNEIQLDSVAIRYKGNSTFYITNSYGIPKLPWNIDINDIISGQKLMGYKKIKLANSAFDATFIKEILGYSIYQRYLPSPEANFMRVNLQGEYLGLYINIEPVDKTFLKKHFNEKDGVFFKCDPIQRYGISGPSGNSDLTPLGSDSTNYYDHYELKSDYGWKELIHMIDLINHYPNQIDSLLNVDRILWAFAVNQAILNFDAYNGTDQRNYYLYQTGDGLFQMIPWDVSESFINALLGDFNTPNDAYHYDPYRGAKCWWYPLTSKLTANPDSKYGRIYTAHLRTIMEESLDTSQIMSFVNHLQKIAQKAVEEDPNNYWDNDLYKQNIYADHSIPGYSFAGLLPTINKRKEFLSQHPELQKVPPVIAEVDVHSTNNSYYVTAHVSNVEMVELMVSTNAYGSKFKSYEMNDSGTNSDAAADDGIYTAEIINGDNTKFYIRASNNEAVKLAPQRAEFEYYNISNTTGIEPPVNLNPFTIYPSPTNGIVYIKGDLQEAIKFDIFSPTGKKVMDGVVGENNNAIDLSPFPNGIYLLKIRNKTTKVLKTK